MENSIMEEKKRPDFLKVLCILTFIGATFGIIGGIVTMLFGNPALLESIQTIMDNAGQDSSMINAENFAHSAFNGIMMIVLNLLSLVGAIMMYNLNKIGFYLYALALVLFLFVGTVYGGMEKFSYVTLVWNGLWIGMYASNLKYMIGLPSENVSSVEEVKE